MDSINGFVWSRKEKVSDDYCWTCHSSEPTLFCASCVRSFHESPACSHSKKMTAEAMQTWRCPECCAIEKDEQQINAKKIDTEYVNKVLKFVLDRLRADEYLQPHFREIDYSKSAKSAAYPMDLLRMSQKIENRQYRCWLAFFADIKWIAHNTKSRKPPKSKASTATHWLMKFTRNELYSIRLCHECYVNANEHPGEWVSMVCNGKHPVVWAKLDTYPHWPAKLMGQNEQDLTVDVQFFGDDSRAIIPSNNCSKYTENCPSSNLGGQKNNWNTAQAAAKVYIENLTSKCGPEIMLNPKIPKPIPARRLTISGHDLSTLTAARIAKRRSTNWHHHSNGKTSTDAVNHQRAQRVQFGQIKSTNQNVPPTGKETNPKFSIKIAQKDQNVECSKSLECPGKKQKLDQTSNGEAPKLKQAKNPENGVTEIRMLAGQNGKFVGKNEEPSKEVLPMVPFNPNVASYESNATKDDDSSTPDCATITMAPSISQQFSLLTESEMKSDDKKAMPPPPPPPLIPLTMKSSPELVAKCENIVEKAMTKYTELTRSSFTAIVHGLLRDHERQLNLKENALECQRVDYDGVIDTLRAKTQQLTAECDALRAQNVKLKTENSALTTAANSAAVDHNKLTAELEVANGKIVALHSNINEMVNQNGILHAKVGDLEKLNVELTAMQQVLHEKLQRTMSELQKASQDMALNGRNFSQFCEELKTKLHGANVNANNEMELHRLRQQNQWQAHQIQHMHNTFEMMKKDAVAETKKRAWCQGCGNPGDPYYCNQCRLQRISRNPSYPVFGQQNPFANYRK